MGRRERSAVTGGHESLPHTRAPSIPPPSGGIEGGDAAKHHRIRQQLPRGYTRAPPARLVCIPPVARPPHEEQRHTMTATPPGRGAQPRLFVCRSTQTTSHHQRHRSRRARQGAAARQPATRTKRQPPTGHPAMTEQRSRGRAWRQRGASEGGAVGAHC